jgi:Predicted nucleotidyltransferase
VVFIKIAAIIAEYNPLHNGHLYQIKKTKEMTDCDALICIMSGNFVQRGEPALIDKWSRTEMALKNGIDLVLELPVLFSLSSAEFFADGAVTILDRLNVIDTLCFGSEVGNIERLKEIAEILVEESDEYKALLKKYISQGNSYPSARSKALCEYTSSSKGYFEETIATSNNILGIEYYKSLLKNKSSITPITIKREGGSYNSTNFDKIFSSASAIRNHIINNTQSFHDLKEHIPSETYNIIRNYDESNFASSDKLLRYIKYKAFQESSSLKNLPDTGEGLDNRIINNILHCSNYNDLISNIKTKRYTSTRIARILCQYFIGFEKFKTSQLRNSSPSYTRVLGFNNSGLEVLRLIKNSSELNIITKMQNIEDEFLKLDLLSTKMYSLINTAIKYNSDFTISPIKL